MVIRKKKVKPAHPCQRAGTKAGQKTIYAASATIIPVLLDVESERPRRLTRDLDRPSVLAMLRRPHAQYVRLGRSADQASCSGQCDV
jgi:hypothetical protein